MAFAADELRGVLTDLGINTVLIGAHAANGYRLEVRNMVEDVIVHKLIAGRPRDLDDIRSIRSTNISFDEAYVENKARDWSVAERWNEIHSSSG